MTHVATIVKARAVNNRAVEVIETLPGIDESLIKKGHVFSSNKIEASYGQIVYVKVRAHPSRTHTMAFEIQGTGGTYGLEATFNKRKGEADADSVIPDFEEVDSLFIDEPEVEVEEIGTEPHFYVSNENAEVFGAANKALKERPEVAFKILTIGDSGYGKTSMAQRYAEKTGMDCVRMNCASIRDPEEWFGFRIAEEGSTKFMPSNFIKSVTAGNCVVILDEFNRLEPWLTNTIYPMLDHDQKTEIYNEVFEVGHNVLWVATVNIGFQFSGTFTIDEALANRFDAVARVGDIPSTDEMLVLQTNCQINRSDADMIVTMANKIRKDKIVPCSIRSTLQIAKLVGSGLSVRSAFEHSVITAAKITANEATLKALVDLVNTDLGVYKPLKKNMFDFS